MTDETRTNLIVFVVAFVGGGLINMILFPYIGWWGVLVSCVYGFFCRGMVNAIHRAFARR